MILASDDSIINIVIAAVFYVGYSLWEAYQKRQESGPGLGDEIAEIREFIQHLETRAQQLAHYGTWRRVSGPLWIHILMPKAQGLLGYAHRLGETDPDGAGWKLAHRREQLEWLADQLDDLARSEHGEIPPWVGSALYIALDELSGEVGSAFTAYPDADILARGVANRADLQHLYAAWAPTLFPDIATAVLDETSAREALGYIETTMGAHEALEAGEPPEWVRGAVIAQVLGQKFRGHAPSGELIIRSSSGQRFALPEEIVAEDLAEITRRLHRRGYASLGGRTLETVRDSSVARAPQPQPQPTPKAAPAPKPAKKPAQVRAHVVKHKAAKQRQPAAAKQAKTAKLAPARQPGKARQPRRRATSRSTEVREAIVLSEILRI